LVLQQHRPHGAEGEIELLLSAKALEGVEDAVTPVLEGLGERLADGGQQNRLQR